MITIQRFVFNPFGVNTFVLYDETKECVIIDAACYFEDEKLQLKSFIDKNQLNPIKILMTHGHVDHLLGNKFIASNYPISIETHIDETNLISGAVSYGSIFGFDVETPPPTTKYLNEGEIVKFGNSELNVLYVPGHSPGSLAYFNKEQNFVFVGDVLFHGSIGRTDLPQGNHEQLIKSINEKLLILDDKVIVYSGHGDSTTIGFERNNNPFL